MPDAKWRWIVVKSCRGTIQPFKACSYPIECFQSEEARKLFPSVRIMQFALKYVF